MRLLQPQRIQTTPMNPQRDAILAPLQAAAPIVFGEPEMMADPDFWSGVAKEATFGLVGLPGDIGYLAGGVAAPVLNALSNNWNEGAPLTQGLFENVGDPTDYAFTSDALAAAAGMPYSNTPNEIRGRVLGGLIDVGTYGALARHADTLVDNALAPRTLSRGPLGGQRGAIVYHGSPYKFDAFDFSHIGKGEGAQAYGHGLYFADSPGVAQDYQRNLSTGRSTLDGKPLHQMSMLERDAADYAIDYGGKDMALSVLDGKIKKNSQFDDIDYLRKVRDKLSESDFVYESGSLYHVDLPDAEIEKFLDWDAPLNEQPEVVQDAIRNNVFPKLFGQRRWDAIKNDPQTGSSITGQEIYHRIEEFLTGMQTRRPDTQKFASEELRKLGIPGIKYYDGMSRGAGEGTRNYVVFDDQLPTIISRNGEPINPLGAQPIARGQRGAVGPLEPELPPRPSGLEGVADEDLLVTTHNLSAPNLMHADRMGGLPMPSIGISKAGNPIEGFGEVTLVDSNVLATPRRGNPVYSADAYSPTYPSITYRMKNTKVVDDALKASMDEFGQRYPQALNEFDDRGADAFANDPVAMHAFLKSKNQKPDVAMTTALPQKRYEEIADGGLLKYVDDKRSVYALEDDAQFQADVFKAQEDAWVKAFGTAATPEEGFPLEASDAPRLARSVARDIGRLRDGGMTPKPNANLSRDTLRKQIDDAGLQGEFDGWIAGLMERGGSEERIFRGFTNAGNRSYAAHTLDNVVREMKKADNQSPSLFGAGAFRSRVAPRFKSLKGVQSARSRIVGPEELDAAKDAISSRLAGISDQLTPYLKYKDSNPFIANDQAMENLMGVVAEGDSWDAFFSGVPQSLRDDALQLVEDMKNMPTGYFEAKPQRAVALEEFQGALVPEDAADDVINALQGRGIKRIERYSDAEDRKNKLMRFRDLMFSLAPLGIGGPLAAGLYQPESGNLLLPSVY